jgi:hypothetical protein
MSFDSISVFLASDSSVSAELIRKDLEEEVVGLVSYNTLEYPRTMRKAKKARSKTRQYYCFRQLIRRRENLTRKMGFLFRKRIY